MQPSFKSTCFFLKVLHDAQSHPADIVLALCGDGLVNNFLAADTQENFFHLVYKSLQKVNDWLVNWVELKSRHLHQEGGGEKKGGDERTNKQDERHQSCLVCILRLVVRIALFISQHSNCILFFSDGLLGRLWKISMNESLI